MKHLQHINEFFKSPDLNQNDIEEMIEYLEVFTEKNDYDIYKEKPLDVSMPISKERRITKEDPYGEEDWEIEKPKTMSQLIMIFENASDKAKKILTFAWMTNGKNYRNDLYIDYSHFENIDLKFLKQIIEE